VFAAWTTPELLMRWWTPKSFGITFISCEIDARTGYVIDLSQLKAIVEREVVNYVDHRNFNLDVPFMQGIIPTSENIIVAFWRALVPVVSPGTLIRLVLWETDNNYVEYGGE